MSTQARRTRILEALQHTGTISVEELSTRFGVSSMTIRRDLAALEQAREIQRVHGGATLAGNGVDKIPSPDRADVVILNPMDQRTARIILQDASRSKTPIIAESIPFPGSATLVAIDSFRAGLALGQWVGQYVQAQMSGIARVLFVGFPTYSDTAERERGFFEGLTRLLRPTFTLSVNARGEREPARQVTLAALSTYPDVNVIIGHNDQSTLGALDAMRELRLPLDRVLVGTFGLEGSAGKRILTETCPRSVGVAMFPEFIGRACANVAIKAYNGISLPAQVVTPTLVVTRETLSHYYTRCHDGWQIRWEAIQDIPPETWAPEAANLVPGSLARYPRRIDFVRYLHDEYYGQLIRGLQERAAEFGIAVQITDASADLAVSIDLMRQAIGKKAASLVAPGEAVILDAGKTNAYLAQELARRRDGNFTVITNSVPAIEALAAASHITLVGIGGILHRPSQSFLSTPAEAMFAGLRADKAFLGVAGINIEHGISNTYLAEADFKRAILRAAKEVIVVADSFKIGEIALAKIAPVSAIHKLVTDDQIPSQDRLAFIQAGVEVILASAA